MLVLASPGIFSSAAGFANEVAKALIAIRQAGHDVHIVSNHEQPSWFAEQFTGTKVQFCRAPGRQSGDVVKETAAALNLATHDVLVLAASSEDIKMGKNGRAVVISAGWSSAPRVSDLCIGIKKVEELVETVHLTDSWPGQWWFSGNEALYSVRALSDLSTFNKNLMQCEFGERVKRLVKQGGSKLTALLTIASRSLLMENDPGNELAFGVYPSSSSANDDDEVLSDFGHRLRTTVSRVQFAKPREPLFIRHMPSSKRSMGDGRDRHKPNEQLETIHLNPAYRGKLDERHVFVIDDCTTYGVSFGVAAALLRKAGAKNVTGVALGKFGSLLQYYEIAVHTDPFKPISTSGYTVMAFRPFVGSNNVKAQNTLVSLV